MTIEKPFDPDEHRREAMMEGSGFSSHLADARLSDEAIPGTTELPRTPRPKRKPRPTGHVRDFESDRDHELAEERAAYKPPTSEQQIASIRGAALAEKAIADRVIQSISDRVDEEIPLDDYDIPKSLAAREKRKTLLIGEYFAQRDAKKAARAESLAKLENQ